MESEQPPALSESMDMSGTGSGNDAPNLVDSILQSIQSGTGESVVGEPSIPIGPTDFDHLLPHPLQSNSSNAPLLPLSEFSRARKAILDEHIPRVQRLARNVIAGMYVNMSVWRLTI